MFSENSGFIIRQDRWLRGVGWRVVTAGKRRVENPGPTRYIRAGGGRVGRWSFCRSKGAEGLGSLLHLALL